MPDNDREDTATRVPVTAPHPSMEEELPTSITTSPTAAIERALEEEEPEPPSEDGPTGIAKAPSKPAAEEHSPADDDGPTSISRVTLDDDWEAGGAPVAAGAPPEPAVPELPKPPEQDPHEDGPTGVTKVDLPPPDEVPTGKTARPAGVVMHGARTAPEDRRHLAQDPEEDSVVTLQKPIPDLPIPDLKDDDSIVTIQPMTAKSAPRLVSAVPLTHLPAASDIYDVDDDKTERRDLPSEEINRAIARAKLEPVAISELPDESPTARRADLALTPKVGVRAASAQAVEEEPLELSTETDLGPIVRRSLGEDVMRPPFGSEADSVITEPAIDKEMRVPHAANLKHTAPLVSPKTTQMGMPPPPRPPEQSLGTDSYTFQGGAGELQAVIPVTTSAPKASVERGERNAAHSTVPPPSNSLLLSSSGAPSTQSMALHPLPGYPPAPSSHPQLPTHAPTAASSSLMPTAPAAFPPGLPPGAFLAPMGSSPNALGLPSSTPRGPVEEPRWIVLVLGVLAVCILIPTVLYLALRSRADEAAVEELPVRGVVTIQTAQPRDYPKAERRR